MFIKKLSSCPLTVESIIEKCNLNKIIPYDFPLDEHCRKFQLTLQLLQMKKKTIKTALSILSSKTKDFAITTMCFTTNLPRRVLTNVTFVTENIQTIDNTCTVKHKTSFAPSKINVQLLELKLFESIANNG